MTSAPALSAALLDQVVSELESGRVTSAVLTLAGMLDAVATGPEEIAACRSLIASHPIRRFLDRSSVGALARCNPAGLSVWERQLHSAVGQLGFVRGLKARRELGARAVEAAWRRGKRIALLDCGELGELDQLNGHALDNVALVHRDRRGAEAIAAGHGPSLTILDWEVALTQRFDLLLASGWADDCGAEVLNRRFRCVTAVLAPGGTLLLSSFAPGHLSAGWQAVCLGRDLHCHSETSLTAAARAAGLAITHYWDSSGSLIWAAFHHAPATGTIKGESTWISPPPSAQ